MIKELELARDLAQEGDLDRAYIIANRGLKRNPNDFQWLNIMAYIMHHSDKPAIAYSLAKRATEVEPKYPNSWLLLGQIGQDLRLTNESLRASKKAAKLSNDPREQAMANVNISAALLDHGEFAEAEDYAKRALELDADSGQAIANLGFCQLARREWKEGWKNYHKTIGRCEWRPIQQYNDEPEWNGEGTGNIVLWADQGLGDVISFGSMIPDIAEWAKYNRSTIILDIDKRLEGLFKRSFPDVTVYGTRGQKNLASWSKAHRDVHYSLPLGQCGEFFRNSNDDFPGTPYLKPDEDRVYQWKALFKAKKKPVIGIAWTGGIDKTGAQFRRVDLEQLRPVLESVDAHWVSLQYKPAEREIKAFKEKYPHIDIVEYPHATLTNDYDDTVAMVAALDHVVAMHTTVVHVAGGLGIPCWVFVPKNSQWRYGTEGEDFVWADSVRILRQIERGQWKDVINQTAKELHARFSRVRKAAGKTARKGKLRSNSPKVRANGKSDHRQARAGHPA